MTVDGELKNKHRYNPRDLYVEKKQGVLSLFQAPKFILRSIGARIYPDLAQAIETAFNQVSSTYPTILKMLICLSKIFLKSLILRFYF